MAEPCVNKLLWSRKDPGLLSFMRLLAGPLLVATFLAGLDINGVGRLFVEAHDSSSSHSDVLGRALRARERSHGLPQNTLTTLLNPFAPGDKTTSSCAEQLKRMHDLYEKGEYDQLELLILQNYDKDVPPRLIDYFLQNGAARLVYWIFERDNLLQKMTSAAYLESFKLLAEFGHAVVTDDELVALLTKAHCLIKIGSSMVKEHTDALMLLTIHTWRVKLLKHLLKPHHCSASGLLTISVATSCTMWEYSTTFIEASKCGPENCDAACEMIRVLFKHCSDVDTINRTDSQHKTALYYAAKNGRLEMVRLLGELGAKVSMGISPLVAVDYNGDSAVDMVRELLRLGAQSNVSEERKSALYRAVEADNVMAVELLRLHQASVEFPAGSSALGAINHGSRSAELLKKLLHEKSMEWNASDLEGGIEMQTRLQSERPSGWTASCAEAEMKLPFERLSGWTASCAEYGIEMNVVNDRQ